jgi:hypothetical protein
MSPEWILYGVVSHTIAAGLAYLVGVRGESLNTTGSIVALIVGWAVLLFWLEVLL